MRSETAVMTQATRISRLSPGHPDLRKPASYEALGNLNWRASLQRLTLYLGALMKKAYARAAALQQTLRPAPPPPDHRAPPEPEPDEALEQFSLIRWLKHFVVYLGAVATICLLGLYFLWQIPFLKDPSQLLGIVDDSRAPRPTAATAPPAAPVPPAAPAAPVQAAPSPPAVNPPAVPGQPPAPTDAVATATAPPATPTAATDVQPSPEAQPAAASPGQAEQPATPPTETAAEAVPPPPPTPQAEIEQLLTDAQQQMENRRFTAPTSGNALSTYRRILELQPDHPTALEGIQRITTYYRDIAQQTLQQGRLDESLAYINRGLRATPQNEALLSLRRQIQQAQRAARQREQQERQRQAALEEIQRQQLELIRQEQLRRQPDQQQQPWWRQPSNNNDNSSGGFNQR